MTRRSLNILLHWTMFLLLLAMLKGGTMGAAWRGAYVAAGALWLLLLIPHGPRARPGPKLTGLFRSGFRAAHWALYALIAVSVILMAATFFGAPYLWAWNALLVLLVAATFHAIFHLWRHTTLYDGALRNITPKAIHKHL